jgi:hypothetical protein
MEAKSFENVLDAKVVAAFSSLTTFSCELSNGKGVLVEAVGNGTASGAGVNVKVVESGALPREMDAVCRVDWTWIYGTSVKGFTTTSGGVRFDLSDVGPLTISAQVWQGKPFLAFQPFRPAK